MDKTLEVLGLLAAYMVLTTGVWWLFFWLWNAIAADVFGAPELTFWQSVGLLVLLGLLTKGVRLGSSKRSQ